MDGSLLGRFLQRPQSSDSGMDFQFMPGPSSKGQKPVHKKSTSLDVGSQQSVDQTAKKQGAVAMMPPPLIPSQSIRDPCKEGAGSWESQSMSFYTLQHDLCRETYEADIYNIRYVIQRSTSSQTVLTPTGTYCYSK